MLGAIIGDVVGSRFEYNNTNSLNFVLFTPESGFTDDTICSIAVADAIMSGRSFTESIHYWCRKYPYPKGGYGGSFVRWVQSENPKPYNSFGNGSAMRVSACAWLSGSESNTLAFAKESAECTHNHPEGVKGALAVADAIWLLRMGHTKEQLKLAISSNFGYNLNQTCNEIREGNSFNETCQVTVPQAIVAFLESDNFEHAIRLAVSLGGDSDTIAAITGSIAEAYYFIPAFMEEAALSRVTRELKGMFLTFKKYML